MTLLAYVMLIPCSWFFSIWIYNRCRAVGGCPTPESPAADRMAAVLFPLSLMCLRYIFVGHI